ncbi:MAG: hypothetical protein EAZ44_04420 [Cytophagia bacterium]|nr:MAG: hypothetical protein EAZ44_04420 [Cytophagia bacterium]
MIHYVQIPNKSNNNFENYNKKMIIVIFNNLFFKNITIFSKNRLILQFDKENTIIVYFKNGREKLLS